MCSRIGGPHRLARSKCGHEAMGGGQLSALASGPQVVELGGWDFDRYLNRFLLVVVQVV
jgi:hypothetical protein